MLRTKRRTEQKPLTLPIRRKRLARHGGVRQVHMQRIPPKGWFIYAFIRTRTMNHTQKGFEIYICELSHSCTVRQTPKS